MPWRKVPLDKIEHKFDYRLVTHTAGLPRSELLERLRLQASGNSVAVKPAFPVPPALARLLPSGGLVAGAAYSLGTAGALLLSLLAEPSREGSWCGVIGMPELGAEAAERAGVVLDRLALVPDPQGQWLAVTAALAEVVPVIAVRPGGPVREKEATRLAARLRDRGGVLLVHGDWPRAEALLEVTEPRWSGMGAGYGYLERREVLVRATSKRFGGVRSVRLELPAPNGRLLALGAARGEHPDGLRVAG